MQINHADFIDPRQSNYFTVAFYNNRPPDITHARERYSKIISTISQEAPANCIMNYATRYCNEHGPEHGNILSVTLQDTQMKKGKGERERG